VDGIASIAIGSLSFEPGAGGWPAVSLWWRWGRGGGAFLNFAEPLTGGLGGVTS